MGVVAMLSGLMLFIGGHGVPMMAARRARWVERFGVGPVKLGVTAVVLAGFLLIIWGFANRPFVSLWVPPIWTRHLALTLMAPAMILLVLAYLPMGKIKAAVRHPMLLAVKIWAVAHLLANGDLWSMVLFVALLLWAGADRASVARRERAAGVKKPSVAAAPLMWDAVGVAVGAGVFWVFAAYLHPMWIGVPVLP